MLKPPDNDTGSNSLVLCILLDLVGTETIVRYKAPPVLAR